MPEKYKPLFIRTLYGLAALILGGGWARDLYKRKRVQHTG